MKFTKCVQKILYKSISLEYVENFVCCKPINIQCFHKFEVVRLY